MATWSLMLSVISLIAALGAVTVARSFSVDIQGISARLASISGELSRLERSERLTPSLLAELAAVQDAIQKGNDLLKRVNSREVMRERRNGSSLSATTASTKDDLRRLAGLRAGQAPNHQ